MSTSIHKVTVEDKRRPLLTWHTIVVEEQQHISELTVDISEHFAWRRDVLKAIILGNYALGGSS